MRVVAFWYGLANVIGSVSMAIWLTYLQWWVHPEYTRPMLFWAYPVHVVSMIVTFFLGVTLLERTWAAR